MNKNYFIGLMMLVMCCKVVGAEIDLLGQQMSLYEKLKTLFESSDIPYDIPNEVIKSADEVSRFSGCAWASPDNKSKTNKFIFVKSEVTLNPSHGPLDPREVKSFYIVMTQDYLKHYLSNGGKFREGILNFDSVHFRDSHIPGCDDDTHPEDALRLLFSGFIPDQKAFVNKGYCKNGNVYDGSMYRKSGDYLIGKHLYDDVYSYCWK